MRGYCTMCGSDFDQETKRGRPDAQCSNLCKEQAKSTTMRFCRRCAQPFDMDLSDAAPYYCSVNCRHERIRGCKRCGDPVPDNAHGTRRHSVFCGPVCMYAAMDSLPCFYCKGPVPPQTKPPWIRPQRYCCQEHRLANQAEIGKRTTEQDEFERNVLTPFSKELPTNGGYPYRATATAMDNLPLHAQCSIDFYNEILPLVHKGLKGDGAMFAMACVLIGNTPCYNELGHPFRLETLQACWPWIDDVIRPLLIHNTYRDYLNQFYKHNLKPIQRRNAIEGIRLVMARASGKQAKTIAKYMIPKLDGQPTLAAVLCTKFYNECIRVQITSWMSEPQKDFYKPAIKAQAKARDMYRTAIGDHAAGIVPAWSINGIPAPNAVEQWARPNNREYGLYRFVEKYRIREDQDQAKLEEFLNANGN